MKKILLFFASCVLGNTGQAQQLHFTYDSAGNQIKRELTIVSVQTLISSVGNDINRENEFLTEEPLIEAYPNPVVDLLKIEWPSNLELVELLLFDNNGRMLQLKKASPSINSLTFDMSSYAQGLYYIRIFDNKKQSRTFKIIKK